MIRKFKHKTTGNIATETNSEKNYKVSEPKNFTIPKWIIEDSEDWEEIKEYKLRHKRTGLYLDLDKYQMEKINPFSIFYKCGEDDFEKIYGGIKEFPKIVSFRRTDTSEYIINLTGRDNYNGWSLGGMLHTGECVDSGDIEIYQVAVSESEIFTLGDKVSVYGNLNKGVINEFKVIGDNKFKIGICIDDYVNIYTDIASIKKYKEPILVTNDNVEIFEGDEYFRVWNIDGKLTTDSYKCFATKEYKHGAFGGRVPHFSTKKAAETYIEQNKPIYSRKQVREALECAVHEYIKYVNSTSWERTFKQKLNL